MNDWKPTEDSISLIRERIKERMINMKNIKFSGY